MRRTRLILVTSLCALAVPLVAASGAQAQSEAAACAFTGATGNITPGPGNTTNGVESVVGDLLTGNRGDALLGDPLTDTDNGSPTPDGTYTFATGPLPGGLPNPSLCLAVDSPLEASNDTGLYLAQIASEGEYENIVCGTGRASDTGASDITSVNLTPTPLVLPGATGERVSDTDYDITFVAGNGPLLIRNARNVGDDNTAGTADDKIGSGAGVVNILPTAGAGPSALPPLPAEPCITQDVATFQASGAFAVVW